MENMIDNSYRGRIAALVKSFPIPIDLDVIIDGRPPTSASSEFLTNKEQGDWAERLVIKAINDISVGIVAIPYGRSDSVAAGDPGFAEFYKAYQKELNTIGKRPDILLFRKSEAPANVSELSNDECVKRAIAAIEVRSSSFLCEKYKASMAKRLADAEAKCMCLKGRILAHPYGDLLHEKNRVVFQLLKKADAESFRELTFRLPSWSSSEELRTLSAMLKELKDNINQLHRRDYLSVTPKLEDIALVNRWITKYNVPHFYLQVFFDRAYMISFEKILSLCRDTSREGHDFSIETDVKNQGKTTIKVNIDLGEPIIGKIDMPSHFSSMKELDRGRLLFFVKFDGGHGYLDLNVFNRIISP